MSGEPIETMKTFTLTASVLAFVLGAGPALAQMRMGSPAFEPLRVVETSLPVFPYELTQLGIREGEVRVAFSVDTKGRIDDSIAVAYTHPEFARITLAAMKRWRFEPARYHGQPIDSASEISVKFETEGTVVVSLTPSELINARISSLLDSNAGYRPRALSELDRIPTPIAAPSPGYPARYAKPGTQGSVTVAFYIDEAGAVRLPSVSADEDPELAAAAISALKNWKFEPPTCKGRPVLVRASQQFNFRSPEATASTASHG
jgi:TonB family protein